MLHALNAADSGPAADFFEAYALFGLSRRPAALRVLGDQKSGKATALRALLDGGTFGQRKPPLRGCQARSSGCFWRSRCVTIEAERANAAVAISYKRPDDVGENWLKQASPAAAVAAYWSPGQNRVAQAGLIAMGIPSAQLQYLVDAYGHDYPRQALWPQFLLDSSFLQPMALEALAFSSVDVSALSWLPPGAEPGHAGASLSSLGDLVSAEIHRNPSWPRIRRAGR
jgi:hypothetical protein